MIEKMNDISDKADAAFRAAMVTVIETCQRTKTPLLAKFDGEMREIPHDQIEKYIDVEALRKQVEQERPNS
ncbi:hypothetical protein C5Y96_11510 [Blastopirellula marina]|uniref:Uncharacterized protein n=1 Tax=Blastopirellula marina TaxID=124 RepID=A0A2S8FMN8_9BACT|nr:MULTISPECIES: hypothetical protein [Pirellulaceae]PQO33462.1 hypothetical protein C5Y96_11510 [Blastopirellula marina]RCS52552.1 hypothetical protein DTL36_11520 [Bremerella cremea]